MAAGYDGLRVSRTDGTDTQVFYLYDGTEPVVQFSSAGVVNIVATFGANGLMSRYGQDFASGYKKRFFAFDPQGNCAEMVDDEGADGGLLLSATYDAFGNMSYYPSSTLDDAYSGYGAQWGYFADFDQSWFYLLGHRFYDPANGRFADRARIGHIGGSDEP